MPPQEQGTPSSTEAVIQVHTSEAAGVSVSTGVTPGAASTGGQRVALVTSQSNPNQISIVPADQLISSSSANENDSIVANTARTRPTKLKCKSSASCGVLKDHAQDIVQDPDLGHNPGGGEMPSASKKRRKSAGGASKTPLNAPGTPEGSLATVPPGEAELPEKEEYKIQLNKDVKGLGITIAGYVCEKGKHCIEKNIASLSERTRPKQN